MLDETPGPATPTATRPGPTPRRKLSKSERFRVLERDRFTCQYCGRKAPEVELHVDHAVPLAAGGADDPRNYRTSCADCNLGKGARRLSDGSAVDQGQRPPEHGGEQRAEEGDDPTPAACSNGVAPAPIEVGVAVAAREAERGPADDARPQDTRGHIETQFVEFEELWGVEFRDLRRDVELVIDGDEHDLDGFDVSSRLCLRSLQDGTMVIEIQLGVWRDSRRAAWPARDQPERGRAGARLRAALAAYARSLTGCEVIDCGPDEDLGCGGVLRYRCAEPAGEVMNLFDKLFGVVCDVVARAGLSRAEARSGV